VHCHLTVQQPFGKYERGSLISDPAEVAAILAGPNRHSVTQRIPAAEHVSGDFHRTDAEIAERNAA
jgi:hypothetical protein